MKGSLEYDYYPIYCLDANFVDMTKKKKHIINTQSTPVAAFMFGMYIP